MPKVKYNKFVESISGQVGGMIFYQADGQNLSRSMPQITAERTAEQQANSGRFQAAQQYAAKALADPALKAAYKALVPGPSKSTQPGHSGCHAPAGGRLDQPGRVCR